MVFNNKRNNQDYYVPQSKKQSIRTTDIYLVAAILTLGGSLVGEVDTIDPRHVAFNVEAYDIDRIQQLWVNRKLEGNLVAYTDNLRNVRMLVHSR